MQTQPWSLALAALRALPAATLVFDRELRVVECSDALSTMLSVPRAAILSIDLRCLRDETIRDCFLRAAAGEVVEFEGSHASALAGRELRGKLRIAPVRDADGALAGGVATVIEDRPVERSTQDPHARLALVWQAAIDGMWEYDLATGELSLSQRAMDMFGYAPDELPRSLDALVALIHPDDLPATHEAFEAHTRTRAAFDRELRLRDADGAFRHIRARALALWDEDGTPRRVIGSISDTTPLHRARIAAQEAEAMFRALVEQSLTGIYMIENGCVIYANPRFAEMFGYELEELVAISPLDLVADDERAHVAAELERRAAADLYAHYVTRGRRKDGSHFWVEVYGTSHSLPGRGRVVIGTMLDISARRAAEERTRELLLEAEAERRRLDFERRRLADIIAQAPTFFAVTHGREHVFELANDAYVRLVGGREVVGKRVVDALPEIRGQGLVELLDQVLATGEAYTARSVPVMLERHGRPETRFLTFTYMATKDEQGRATGIICNGSDVTEQVLAERSIRDSEQRMRAQFKALPVPTYAWQLIERSGVRDFVLSGYSDSARDAFSGGAEALERLLGVTATAHFAAQPAVIDAMWRALEERRPVRYENEFVAADGVTRRFSVTFSAAPPNIVLAHVENVTERAALEEQLRQAQKMEAVGQLAGGFAHDLNNILCVIRTCGEFLSDATSEQRELNEDVQDILRAADRATALTQHLLTFSRRQVTRVRAVDVHRVLHEMDSMLRRLIGQQIHVQVRPTASRSIVRADRSQLEQVILNLAINARDAMGQTGTLSVATAVDEVAPQHGPTRGIAPGAYLALSVSDTGCGMTPELMRRIFEPFFTTKEPGHGTGLGLSTVYGIVKQLGGTIEVQSEVGVGSTFRVLLPLDREPPSDAPASRRASQSMRRSARVLLVEDEDGVRALAQRILERAGYEVIAASSGPEALAIASDERAPDVLLTDMVMPDMSGRQVHMALRERWPSLRAVYTSGYTDDEVVRAGGDDAVVFLPKPFGAAELLAAMDAALLVTPT